MKSKPRRTRLLAVLPVLLIGLPVWLIHRQVRHERLNRELIVAIKDEDFDSVERLLQQGADANSRDVPSVPVSFFDLLKKTFTRVRYTPTSDTVALNAMQLAVSGWEVVHPGDYTDYHQNWTTKFKIVRLLALHGASVNVLAPNGGGTASPLYLCVIYAEIDAPAPYGKCDMMCFLLAHGARVDQSAWTQFGAEWTPLMEAVFLNDTQAVKILVEAGANVNFVDKKGLTPLSLTVSHNKDGSVHVVDTPVRTLLLKARARK